ncbi:MAG: GNAT family N-acetyltransferase [Thermovirgaceae bacterium]|nr:GNAT family N-acetyltransferase [Thermovirgaceae bacterium]
MGDRGIRIQDLSLEKQEAARKSLEGIRGGVEPEEIVLRPYRAGELGWISWRHCVLYREEYGFDDTFEYYLLAGMVQYLHDLKGKGEVWVADCAGTVVGSIAIVEITHEEIQLRWFLLEPGFRGLGLGKRLMDTALDYCRGKGFEKVFLWTVSELLAARHLYEIYSFSPTETKAHFLWGKNIIEERWDLVL